MNTINPKELFQNAHSDSKQAMAEIAKQPPLRLAIVFAMTIMVNRNATQEQLAGARAFADILLNIGEPEEAAPSFPDKSLKVI